MKRSAGEVAEVLSQLYKEKFGDDQFESYRLEWADLQTLAGGGKLKEEFIVEINLALEENNEVLVRFDRFLMFAKEEDFTGMRRLSGRALNRFLLDDTGDRRVELEPDDDIVAGDDV